MPEVWSSSFPLARFLHEDFIFRVAETKNWHRFGGRRRTRRGVRCCRPDRVAQGRNEKFADALLDFESIRVAVNQEFAELDAPVGQGDEIAIFPPMTGG